MSLTVLKVRHAGPGRHSDIHGLYLIVREGGSRSWVLRIQHQGRRRDFGLGPVHEVTLAEARAKAWELRRLVRAGLDPIRTRALSSKRPATFETVTRNCYEAMKGGWKNQRHASWLASFEKHVFPAIGKTAIDAVDSAQVLSILEPIWTVIPDTARRILQRIGTVLDYAHIKGLVPDEISLRSVTRGLPRQTRRVTHLEAMPYNEVPAFMASLLTLPNAFGRDALKLTILTAVRSNETRFATWDEFDLELGTWSIPAVRMKMKEPHLVPLTAPAIALLLRMRADRATLDGRVGGDKFVFTASGTAPISDMTILKVLRDMKFATVTVHGFRSSFTDWAAECTDFPKEIADKALVHRVPNAVEAAYRRTDFFQKRRSLMVQWTDHVMGKSSIVRSPSNIRG